MQTCIYNKTKLVKKSKNMSSLIRKSEFGQFDTPQHIASSIMSMISYDYDFFIDLGAGLGSLSSPFHDQSGLLIELDETRYDNLRFKLGENLTIINADALDKKISLKSATNCQSILYISNPPFHRKNTGYNFEYFDSLNFGNSFHQLDIAFLDRVLASKNSKSSVVFIVSAPFVESERYLEQRDAFVREFKSIDVIGLDIKTFEQAEVQSYVLIAHHFSNRPNKKITLKNMNLLGNIVDEMVVDQSQAKESLSYFYHKQVQAINSSLGKGYKTLKDFDVSLIRGSQTRKYFNDLGKNFIHTTDLKDQYLYLDRNYKVDSLYNHVEENDILISRVGRRSLARESLVKEGGNIFTESVFRLKTKSKDNQLIWSSISNEVGKKWRELHAQGKCAKYLTRNAILNIPIT